MDLLKNMLGHNGENLEKIVINSGSYLTKSNKDFFPAYMIGLSFGADISESSYNNRLAECVLNAEEYFKESIPKIIQYEVRRCLKNSNTNPQSIYTIGEGYNQKEKSLVLPKISTKDVLIESKRLIEKLNLPLDSALFIAHPCHMERVLYTAEKLGIYGEPFIREKVEWSEKDPQLWVRSPFFFVPREIIARIMT